MRNFQIRMIIILLVTGALFWSCGSYIYDDLKDCPQGVYVKFYAKTTCANDTAFIGKVPSLTVFAFDKDGKLSTLVEQEDVYLTENFEVFVPISNGDYSLIAWAGINEKFKKSTCSPSITCKEDVMLTINSEDGIATIIDPMDRISQGVSSIISLPDPSVYGSLYIHTAVNLREITNRFKVVVEFDEAIMRELDPEKLEVKISSANGTINIDGCTPSNMPVLTYPAIATRFENNICSWDFSMLDLTTACSNTLDIIYNGNNKKETLFTGDLITSILSKAEGKGINLDCENDFTLKFIVDEYCSECKTPFKSDIYINDWHIYSYSTDL